MKISAVLIDPSNRRVREVKLRDTWPAVKELIESVRIFQCEVHGNQLVTCCEPVSDADQLSEEDSLFAFRLQPKLHFKGLAVVIGNNFDVPVSACMSAVQVSEKIVFEGDYGFECRRCSHDKDVTVLGMCNDCAHEDLFNTQKGIIHDKA